MTQPTNLFGEPLVVQQEEVVEETKPKNPGLFDWLKSVTSDKNDMEEHNGSVPGFDSYMIATALGHSQSTIGFANFLNQNPHIPLREQYRLLFHGIPKARVYSKWPKSKYPKELKDFMKATGLPKQKAVMAMKCLTKEQIKRILKPVGGKVKNT